MNFRYLNAEHGYHPQTPLSCHEPAWKSGGATGRSALPAQADIVRSVGQVREESTLKPARSRKSLL